MNATTTRRRFSLYTIVSLIVNGFMLGAAALSFSHIVTTSTRLGIMSWQAYLVPFFIDGLAVLGMIGRSEAMARALAARGCTPEQIADIKRFGFRLQLVAGLLSLAANWYAGHTLGEKLFGILVVTGFVITEKYSEKLRSVGAAVKAAITPADVEAAVDAAIAQTLAQAAIATQAAIDTAVTEALAADAANRAKAERAAKRRERAAAKRVELAAPVSPATVAEIDSSLIAPISTYEPAYL